MAVPVQTNVSNGRSLLPFRNSPISASRWQKRAEMDEETFEAKNQAAVSKAWAAAC